MTKSKSMAVLGIFGAIIFLLAFTPLGFIPLPFVRATTVHIPVIIGAIFLGPKHGAILGFLFGVTSFLIATFQPFPTSFVFSPFVPVFGSEHGSPWALLIAFVPRIFVGVVPYYVYKLLQRVIGKKLKVVSLAVAGVAGSMTNTLLVMGGIFLLFSDPWTLARGESVGAAQAAITGIIVGVGIPEAIVAGVLVAAIGSALGVALRGSYGDAE